MESISSEDIKKGEEVLQAIASALNDYLKGMGFALLVFEFHKPGVSNFISNCERSDMVKALREAANRLEKNQDIPSTIGEA